MCIGTPTAMAVGAGVQGIGGILSGLLGQAAAKRAAKIESQGALTSSEAQAKAIEMAGGQQATGATTAGNVAATGITQGAEKTALGILSGAQTQAAGVGTGTNLAVQGFDSAIAKANGLYGTAKSAFDPYLASGKVGADTVSALLGGPGADPAQIQATLESMPGYQFALTQGLRSTQNSFAAKGLGSSGAAMRGAADYSQGLASTTYNMLFANAMAASQLGETAAEGLGGISRDFAGLFSELEVGKGGVKAEGARRMAEILGLATTSAEETRGKGITGSAAARAEAVRAAAGARAAATAGAGATRAAGKLGSANALAAGEIGGTNALMGGTNALFAGLGNSLSTYGLYGGFNSQNPLLPANANNIGAAANRG